MESIEPSLQKEFRTIKIISDPEIESLLKKEQLFSIVIQGNVTNEQHVHSIQRICFYVSKIPCFVYGKIHPHFHFELGKMGIEGLFGTGEIEPLLEKLRDLKARTTFQIDLRHFGLHMERCSFWTRKYLQFVAKDFNFLRYRTVTEIIAPWRISLITLNHLFKQDGYPPQDNFFSVCAIIMLHTC